MRDRRVRAGHDDRRAGYGRGRREKHCGGAVEVVELPIDDSWFRDSGPIYVVSPDGSRRVALDWVFNGWGEKFAPWEADDAVARRWAEHAGHEWRSVPMVLEGGSITVDGEGTLVTTEQCLLHPNRNPDLSRADIEATLCAELGVTTIVWLPHGLALDDDTDGHVDNVAAFARPGVLVVQALRRPGGGRLAAVQREPPQRARRARRRRARARGRRGPGPPVRHRGREPCRGPLPELLHRQRIRRRAGLREPRRCRDGRHHRRAVPRAARRSHSTSEPSWRTAGRHPLHHPAGAPSLELRQTLRVGQQRRRTGRRWTRRDPARRGW